MDLARNSAMPTAITARSRARQKVQLPQLLLPEVLQKCYTSAATTGSHATCRVEEDLHA